MKFDNSKLKKVFNSEVEAKVHKEVALATADVFRRAQKNINPHYDTGTLEKSGKMDTSKKTIGEVGYNTSYAPHVEFGHLTRNGGWVKGVKYLKRAVDGARPGYYKRMADIVGRTMKGG